MEEGAYSLHGNSSFMPSVSDLGSAMAMFPKPFLSALFLFRRPKAMDPSLKMYDHGRGYGKGERNLLGLCRVKLPASDLSSPKRPSHTRLQMHHLRPENSKAKVLRDGPAPATQICHSAWHMQLISLVPASLRWRTCQGRTRGRYSMMHHVHHHVL